MVDLRLVLALFLLLASTAHARPGDLDRSFGDRGRTAFLRDSGGYVAGMALVDGRRPLLSVGTGLYGNPAPRLLTLTAAGTLAAVTPVAALAAPQFDDGYALTHVGDNPTRYSLERMGESASVALTVPFPSTPLELDPSIGTFGVDRAGRILATVTMDVGAEWRVVAVRYLPDGTLDTSYRSELGNRLIMDSLVRPDGRQYAVAWLRGGGLRVRALDAAGGPLPGFRARALRTGRFRKLEEPALIGWIVRLRADGQLDRRFGDGGLRLLPRFTPNALVHDRRGRIVLAGRRHNRVYGQAGVVRLSPRGNLDLRVAKQIGALRGVRLIASEAHQVAIDDRGRIVLAGATYDDDYGIRDDLGRSYPAVARLQG
jgi:hypothetical protein